MVITLLKRVVMANLTRIGIIIIRSDATDVTTKAKTIIIIATFAIIDCC